MYHLILSFFAFKSLNLSDQLVKLATLSDYLFYVFRRNKNSFMTKDVYMDIQSTIQYAFIYLKGSITAFSFTLGTDPLKLIFRSIRTLTHATNCDLLELEKGYQFVVILKMFTRDIRNEGLHQS